MSGREREVWMITRARTAIAAFIIAGLALAAPARAEDTLYKQLGGYDAIAAVTDAFLTKAVQDKTLRRFFVGHSTASLVRIRQLIVDFICEKAGGPCVYTGRAMADAHTGLKITDKDWDISNKLFGIVLNDLKVEKPLQEKVVAFVGSLKGDIVGR
jgi:hemoglobin